MGYFLLGENGGMSSLGGLQIVDNEFNSSTAIGPPWMNVSEPRRWSEGDGLGRMGDKTRSWNVGDGKIGS